MNRIREGRVAVRNPYNAAQTRVLALSPETVDCIVFWTKDPGPLLPYLPELDARGYRYYFQFTRTPYGRALEPGLREPDALDAAFRALSRRVGRDRIVWRYDPILLTEDFGIAAHITDFTAMCGRLAEYAARVTVSFVDLYPSMKNPCFRAPDEAEMQEIAAHIGAEARRHGLIAAACCERADLTPFGIVPAACIDPELVRSLCGRPLQLRRDRNQRGERGYRRLRHLRQRLRVLLCEPQRCGRKAQRGAAGSEKPAVVWTILKDFVF